MLGYKREKSVISLDFGDEHGKMTYEIKTDNQTTTKKKPPFQKGHASASNPMVN